jgi:acyl-coenzyme A synthetase/AMP-(fatty) acid ligase
LTSPVEIDALTTDIQDFCKRNGSPYKYPRKIQFVEMSFLPKTISGKIQRAVLKATEWKQIEKAKL